jgi:uncharacterized protein
MLRCIPDNFDERAVEEIDKRLASIISDHTVSIPWAIESGSRAWGFPSPDSDYDARMIYVRSIDQYLSPWTPRDVIVMPIEGEMDVNGWDLGKAIKLMLKGNAVVLEWLQSPIIYRGDENFRTQMLLLANQCGNRTSTMRHYFHLGTQQWQRFLAMGDEAPAKKLFYSARPALCLRWMRTHSSRNIPPMHFQTLLLEAETPDQIKCAFEHLVAEKARTRELGRTEISNEIRDFINDEYQLAEQSLPITTLPQSPENVERARSLFFDCVTRYSAVLKPA